MGLLEFSKNWLLVRNKSLSKAVHFLLGVCCLFSSAAVYCQNTTKYLIRGKVLDQKGEPIPYASIHLKDARYGTYTDSIGNFGLQYIHDDSLIIGAIGYKMKSLYPNLTAPNVIALEEKEIVIQAVQVIGTRATPKSIVPYGVVFEKPDFRYTHGCGDVVMTEILISTQSFLKTINFEFGFSKNSPAPVTVIRPMVYAADVAGKPGQLLFASKKLYRIKNRTKSLIINLEREKIALDHQIVFIGIEFMWNETNEGVRFVGHQEVAKSAAASLRCNLNLGIRKTWRQYRGGSWSNDYGTFMGRTMNAAIYGEMISYE